MNDQIQALPGEHMLALHDAALDFFDKGELERWLEANNTQR